MRKIITICLMLAVSFPLSAFSQGISGDNIAAENKNQKKQTSKEEKENKKYHPIDWSWDPPVVLPENLFDTFRFPKAAGPYICGGMLILGPGLVTAMGVADWGWGNQRTFKTTASKVWGNDALNGASDKFGHAFSAYYIMRTAAFLYQAIGYSDLRTNLFGALYSELVMLIIEIGDGLSAAHGFDFHDHIANNIGILFGLLMRNVPVLDQIFTFQWEYIPTRNYLNNPKGDFLTDYSGQKFILATKLAGIPYLSRTLLRYVNVDLGYYAKGYDNKDYKNNTRNIYIGLSINFSILAGDMLPRGYTSSLLQTVFNYVHIPLDYEIESWTLTRSRR